MNASLNEWLRLVTATRLYQDVSNAGLWWGGATGGNHVHYPIA